MLQWAQQNKQGQINKVYKINNTVECDVRPRIDFIFGYGFRQVDWRACLRVRLKCVYWFISGLSHSFSRAPNLIRGKLI